MLWYSSSPPRCVTEVSVVPDTPSHSLFFFFGSTFHNDSGLSTDGRMYSVYTQPKEAKEERSHVIGKTAGTKAHQVTSSKSETEHIMCFLSYTESDTENNNRSYGY